jgi:caffeoyl-CoA O-methyltransferase
MRVAAPARGTLDAMAITDPQVERYAAAHTTPPLPHLADVAAATRAETRSAGMMSGLVAARLLEGLVVATRAQRVLEIGTFTGYGTLSIASRLPAGGTVITVEADDERAAMARRHFDASPDADKVELLHGDAREIVPTLDGPFDLVFIDAWKGDYPFYYEAVLPKLAPHGLIVCDNVLWGGDVVDPDPDDNNGHALAAFNDLVQGDPRVSNALLTVGDGLMVIWHADAD